MRTKRNILFVVVLIIQNLFIFRYHYQGEISFTWDFINGYYPLTAFATSVLQNGIFPQWMPFQQMGYPFAYCLQAGVYYPPNWIFPLLHIPYTIHAANILQCLHILVGATSAYFLFDLLFHHDERLALLGAFCFQVFGGFYSNAQHVDIIRAFSLTPLVFYVFTLSSGEQIPWWQAGKGLPTRLLFIPPVLFIFVTGAYPGNLIATLFIVALYSLLQLIQVYRETKQLFIPLRLAAMIGLLALLGVAMGAVHLLPPFALRSEMLRYNTLTAQTIEFLRFEQIPGLFLSSKYITGEISMSSVYSTLPAIVLAFFASKSLVKRYWAWMAIGLVSLLMIGGPLSPFWKGMTTIMPFLRYSRMVSSDYKIFLFLPILILFLAGLQTLIDRKLTLKAMGIRAGLAFAGVGYFSFTTFFTTNQRFAEIINKEAFIPGILQWIELSNRKLLTIETMLIFFAVIALSFLLYWRKDWLPGSLWVVLVLVLISLDAYRVLPDMKTWRDDQAEENIFGSFELIQDDKLVTLTIGTTPLSTRPARSSDDSYWLSKIRGYIDGKFLTSDKMPCYLVACQTAMDTPFYLDYFQREWTPLLFEPPDSEKAPDRVVLPEAKIAAAREQPDQEQVVITDYGINEIRYDVSLGQPQLLVENEIYFPGWTAELLQAGEPVRIEAAEVNDVFRGWLLPAGQYRMIARFKFPNYDLYRAISLLAAFIWAAILGWNNVPRGKLRAYREKKLQIESAT